jgi:hypothetical protein
LSSLSSTIRTVFAIPPLQSEAKKPTREMRKTQRIPQHASNDEALVCPEIRSIPLRRSLVYTAIGFHLLEDIPETRA